MSSTEEPRSDAAVPGASPSGAASAGASPSGALPPHLQAPDLAARARPLDVDGTTTVAVGTTLWAVAGLVMLIFFRDDLAAEGRGWWLWTCLAGFGLGVLGWVVCVRRRDRLRARKP